MSDLLTAAAAALNVPEELVRRSAEARAAATGMSAEEVLAAWAGGEVAPVPAAAEPSPSGPSPAGPVSTEAAPSPAPSPVSAQEESSPVAVLEAPVAEQVPVDQPEVSDEPVIARPLADRSRLAGRFGSWTGSVTGLLLVVAGSPWLAPRASLTGTEGSYRPAVEVVSGWTFLAVLVLLGLFGAVAAVLSRAGAGWMGPSWQLSNSWRSSALVGAAGGIVGGAVVGGLLVSAFALEGAEGSVLVPMVSGIIVMVVGTALTGRAVAAVVQAVGVPSGRPVEDPEEVSQVRRLLGTALSLPVVGMMTILLFVLPAAWLFLSFPGFAPFLALFIAGGILGFAGLAASRPGMRISVGEFLVAAAGVGVVILIVVAVLLARGGGHEAEGEPAAESAAVGFVL